MWRIYTRLLTHSLSRLITKTTRKKIMIKWTFFCLFNFTIWFGLLSCSYSCVWLFQEKLLWIQSHWGRTVLELFIDAIHQFSLILTLTLQIKQKIFNNEKSIASMCWQLFGVRFIFTFKTSSRVAVATSWAETSKDLLWKIRWKSATILFCFSTFEMSNKLIV